MNICENKRNRLEFKLVAYTGEIIIIREEKKSLVWNTIRLVCC